MKLPRLLSKSCCSPLRNDSCSARALSPASSGMYYHLDPTPSPYRCGGSWNVCLLLLSQCFCYPKCPLPTERNAVPHRPQLPSIAHFPKATHWALQSSPSIPFPPASSSPAWDFPQFVNPSRSPFEARLILTYRREGGRHSNSEQRAKFIGSSLQAGSWHFRRGERTPFCLVLFNLTVSEAHTSLSAWDSGDSRRQQS